VPSTRVPLVLAVLLLALAASASAQPATMILLSGLAEVAGGVGLMQRSPHVRRAAGWGLAVLLVAVYPANIWMAMAEVGGPSGLLWGRLPLQGVLVAAVLLASGAGGRRPRR
jgi:uncharacterized membrane protein